MKKIGICMLSLAVLFLITGCGDSKDTKEEKKEVNVLECTRDAGEVVLTDTYSYDNNKLISLTRENKYYSTYADYDYVLEKVDGFQTEADERGIEFKVDKGDDYLKFAYTYYGEQVDLYNEKLSGMSIDEIKAEYKNIGGVCK